MVQYEDREWPTRVDPNDPTLSIFPRSSPSKLARVRCLGKANLHDDKNGVEGVMPFADRAENFELSCFRTRILFSVKWEIVGEGECMTIPVLDVGLSASETRSVDCERYSIKASPLGPAHKLGDNISVLVDIELEEADARAHGCNLFHAAGRP